MNLRILDSSDDVASAAAEAVVRAIAGRERAAIGLSGGSAPVPLYRLLASSPYRDQLAAIAITWVLIDERYVPYGDPQSNASAIDRELFAAGLPEHHRFLRFDTSLPDAAASAKRFNREWSASGIERLDVAILGCGIDGHTASLFPGSEALAVDDVVSTAVYAAHLSQWRVTLTMPVLRSATTRFVIATGSEKREILARIRAGESFPVTEATKELDSWWFVDHPAW